MLSKLALRNVKRSIKDYMVYLLTITIVSSLMFAFHAMIFSKDIQTIGSTAPIMIIMIGIATVFIIFTVAWLINYMIKFMIEKRSREFGTYLLIGMKKKQIIKLFLRENMLIGFIAFLLGIIPGFLIQKVISAIFNHLFTREQKFNIGYHPYTILLTAGVLGMVYLIVLLRGKKRLKKMNIHDLMYMDKQNEQIKEGNYQKRKYFFFGGLLYLLFFYLMMFFKKFTFYNIWPCILLLAISVYFIYIGLSAFLVNYIKKGKTPLYKNGNLFLLRQLASKVKTMQYTMGTLSIIFIFALLGVMFSIMMNDYQNKMLDYDLAFDVILFSDQKEDSFEKEKEIIGSYNEIETDLAYNVYKDDTTTVNDYLYENLPLFQQQPEAKEVEDGTSALFDYDTHLKISDYNKLRKMIGLEEVELGENNFIIHTKERVAPTLEAFSTVHTLKKSGRELTCAGVYTEGFAQSGQNGADYIIVIPDEVTASMEKFYSLYAADLNGTASPQMEQELGDVRNYSDEYSFYAKNDITWGLGTNRIVTTTGAILVKDTMYTEIQFVLSSITFPIVYMSFVFACVALTILAVQQISDSQKYRFRYQVMKKLGLKEQETNTLILKQLLLYYLCPFLISIVICGVIALYASERFIFYTGIKTSLFLYFGTSILLFGIIYFLYFMVTYVQFRRNTAGKQRG